MDKSKYVKKQDIKKIHFFNPAILKAAINLLFKDLT
jgi:hypothetical protein